MRPVFFSIGPYDVWVAPVFAGFSAVIAYAYFRGHRRYAELSDEQFWNLMLALAIGTLAGAVLYYFFLFRGGAEDNLNFMLRRHRFRAGAFFGAYLGAFCAIWAYARRTRGSLPKLADILGGATPLALSVLRVGCLLQGCCHGVQTAYPYFPFQIIFLHPRAAVRNSLRGVPLYPVQIYASLGAVAIFLIVHFGVFARVKKGKLPQGSVFLSSTIAYFTMRFFLDFIRDTDKGLLHPFGLTTNQFFAILIIAAAIALFRTWRKKEGK